MGHPQGKPSGHLQLHEHQAGRQNGDAPGIGIQRQTILTVPDLRVEGHPEVLIFRSVKSVPLIGEEHGGAQGLIKVRGIGQFRADLAVRPRPCLGKTRQRLILGEGDSALVYDRTVLLFQLHKYHIRIFRAAIATDAELFLINRTLQTAADEPEVRGVQIEVSDGAVAVHIRFHIGSHRRQHCLLLGKGHQVLGFIPLKDHLVFHG